ncbi:hypothetical protein HBN50_04495 [Halobacteriovorax sp. GB3]|uniref:hypothetical protein n=1 Tax=Halobacteriovorax sp. GB3 TaxID=2719615 RepID=UPI002360B5C8|nr:hypothetical protein [Halobacteriovorax sp. GB3]MDD0852342.1 hypothetical protein [Halobacteriovorax sp. GB3]
MRNLISIAALVFWIFSVKTVASDLKHIKINQDFDNSIGGAPFGEQNLLFQTILTELSGKEDDIVQRQADAMTQSGLFGGLNTIGYRYNHDFGSFIVQYRRTLAPDLFHDTRWIVTDEMEIIIEAQKLFRTLSDSGQISIDQNALGAFAGISFKRKYRYVHFAPSYNEGLVIDAKKLLFPFLFFRKSNFMLLKEYEIVTKEDSLSAQAMAVGSVPVQPGLGLQFGGLVKYSRIAKVDVQAIGSEDDLGDTKLKISYEKEKSVVAGASAALIAEFFSFLRLTLLSYDFSYELKESWRTYLSFNREGVFELYKEGGALSNEVKKIMSFKSFDSDIVAPYAISHKTEISEIKKTKYFALVFGGVRDSRTSHIEVVKEGVKESFFRHLYEKIRYRENFFSRLMSSLFQAIFQMPTFVSRDYNELRKVELEYKSKRDIVDSKKDYDVDSLEGDLSLHYSLDFDALKTTGSMNKKIKGYAVSSLKNYTNADTKVVHYLNQDQLVGPLEVKSNFRIAKLGVESFLKKDKNQILNLVKDQCNMKSKNFFKRIRSLFSSCRYKLYNSYHRFIKEWSQENYSYSLYNKCRTVKKRFLLWRVRRYSHKKCIEKATTITRSLNKVPLWRLKDVSREIFYQSRNRGDLVKYYGKDHIFMNGSFSATQQNGFGFRTHFTDGVFNGLGVVKTHLLENQLRTPASVDLE